MALTPRPAGKIIIIAERDFFAHCNIAGSKAGENLAISNIGVGDFGIRDAGVIESRK
jgi:hypothetical protein